MLERVQTILIKRDLVRYRWVRDVSLTMMTMHRGVVGERNPETVSERVYDWVADTARRKKG